MDIVDWEKTDIPHRCWDNCLPYKTKKKNPPTVKPYLRALGKKNNIEDKTIELFYVTIYGAISLCP